MATGISFNEANELLFDYLNQEFEIIMIKENWGIICEAIP